MGHTVKAWVVTCLLAMLQAISAGSLHAESAPSLGEILRKTEQHYQQIQAFTATFHQWTTSSAASSMTTEASGRLFYQKPRQMRWEYDTPEPQVFIANNQLSWFYVPADRQISLFDAHSLFSSPLARTFFDGVVQLKKDFEVSLDHKQTTGGSAVLRLTPKADDPNVKSLMLTVDLSTFRITGIESKDALGNTNRIVLDTQNPSTQLDPKLFQLDIPRGTSVLDVDGRELPPAEVERLKQRLLSK
jgi:outer membrane lipoprotein carrier protein